MEPPLVGVDTVVVVWLAFHTMSIPGWKPNPKWVDEWLERTKWAQWLILIVAIAWLAILLISELARIFG